MGGGGVSDASSGASNTADQIAKLASQVYGNYQNNFLPIQTAIASQYGIIPQNAAQAQQAAMVNAATQQQIQALQSRAAANAAQHGTAATESANRQMMAYGVNPNDARFAGINRAAATNQAIGTINAMNQVPGAVRQQEMGFLNSGNNLVGQAVSAYGAASNAYNAAGRLAQQNYQDQSNILGDVATVVSAFFSEGGYVHAPPGPSGRDTGAINISDGEYVLPTATVRAVGGMRVLDDLVEKTTGRRPSQKYAVPAPLGLLGFLIPGYAGTPNPVTGLASQAQTATQPTTNHPVGDLLNGTVRVLYRLKNTPSQITRANTTGTDGKQRPQPLVRANQPAAPHQTQAGKATLKINPSFNNPQKPPALYGARWNQKYRAWAAPYSEWVKLLSHTGSSS